LVRGDFLFVAILAHPAARAVIRRTGTEREPAEERLRENVEEHEQIAQIIERQRQRQQAN
jgi:hypothetical protein